MSKQFGIDIYPLTIIADRYTGSYSGGAFTAWNCEYYEIPLDAASSDGLCGEFWETAHDKYLIGTGDTPREAMLDLYIKMLSRKQEG